MACMYLGEMSLQTDNVGMDPLVLLAKWLSPFSEHLLQLSSESPVGLTTFITELWWDINRAY